MYVYMCVCMYVYMCVCMYVYIYIYIYKFLKCKAISWPKIMLCVVGLLSIIWSISRCMHNKMMNR